VESAGGGRSSDPDRQDRRSGRPGSRLAAITVEEVHAAAPLERSARVITALVALAVVVESLVLAFATGGGLVVLVGTPSLFVAVLMLPLAFAPSGYALGARDLAVTRRVARPLLFPLAGLAAARATAMPRSWRRLGSGGLFGWWGWFSNRDWGRFKAYATDRRHGVLLEWPGFKLFVSPADSEAFRRAVLARRAAARGQRGGRG
jgi:hypothetical protein